ncbi:MAG: hypothetical protein NVS2B3_09480 [Vulcanimicrobiaceae bacterium]
MLERDASERSLDMLVRLIADAYPIVQADTPEKLAAHTRELATSVRDPLSRWIVVDGSAELVACMKLYEYTMNVRGIDAITSGIGAVAVALAHKRNGIARGLIAWSLRAERERGAAFAILYAFRPSFYRKLGFGYGTPTHRYRFAAAAIRSDGGRGIVRALEGDDLDALLACSERVRAHTNGLVAKHRESTQRVIASPQSRYVGAFDARTLRAFMQTSVVLGAAGTVNEHTLVVRDVHAEDDASLASLWDYLHAQRDQYARIVIESQDRDLFLAAADPRDGSNLAIAPPGVHRIAETGLGVMYRILDVPAAFSHLEGGATAFVLRVEIDDAFFAPTAGSWTFDFTQGGVSPYGGSAGPDATLRIGIADLASLVVGSLGLRALVRHRLATLEPASMFATVARAFHTDAPPLCETRF